LFPKLPDRQRRHRRLASRQRYLLGSSLQKDRCQVVAVVVVDRQHHRLASRQSEPLPAHLSSATPGNIDCTAPSRDFPLPLHNTN
jgi:hypothetical protein